MKEKEVHVSCCCCGDTSWRYMFSTHDFMFDDLLSHYDIYKCRRCGLLKLNIKHDNVDSYPVGQYYSYKKQEGFLDIKCKLYTLCFSPVRKPFEAIRNIVLFPLRQMMRGLRISKGWRVLDVGCGSGKFLSIISHVGMIPEGVDIDPVAVTMAAEGGVKAYCSQFDIDDIKINPGFDLITSNHVIEHVEHPDVFLANVAKLLKPSGTAIIATPEYYSIWGLLFRRFWAQVDAPRHLHIFTQSNMESMCERNGLRILSKRHLSSEVGVVLSLCYLLRFVGIKFSADARKKIIVMSRYIFFPLYSIVNILRVGDSIEYVLCKKIVEGERGE